MEQETVKFAWRTPTGEKNKISYERIDKKIKHDQERYSCNWYYCADENMQDEKVLVYSVEKTSELQNTGIKQDDRFLQKITASGKSCSGKIKNFASIALPGTYNQDGTLIENN